MEAANWGPGKPHDGGTRKGEGRNGGKVEAVKLCLSEGQMGAEGGARSRGGAAGRGRRNDLQTR
jgi:hypothetical protein